MIENAFTTFMRNKSKIVMNSCWDSGKRSKGTNQPHHTITECGHSPKPSQPFALPLCLPRQSVYSWKLGFAEAPHREC